MPYDVSEGKLCLGLGSSGAYETVEALRDVGGGRWRVRDGTGDERTLRLSELRERWHMPLRVLGHVGRPSQSRARTLLASPRPCTASRPGG